MISPTSESPFQQVSRLSGYGIAFCISLFFNPSASAQQPSEFQVPEGLRSEVFAANPMFANPVSVSVAEDGKVYVSETRRRKASNLDIRNNADWLDVELSLKSVADKEAFYRSTLTADNSEANRRRVEDYNQDGLHDWKDLTVLSESIHELRDTDGDGIADESSVFAEDFNTIVTGVAAGVMAFDGDVYTTIAPDVWKLRDADGDGVSDQRDSIAQGFAVHIAYAGHNMHGLTVGPDGKIYWSIGDIASDYYPNEGAVFRCNPDGSDFEVFAHGLRNPQELAFDQFGNLFTGDNDGDFGDRERWYYVVQDGDYGWRTYWQYRVGSKWGAEPGDYHVWNDEGLWHKWFPEQPAWVLPPVEYIAGGPCGLSYYPGTGFGDEFDNHFFLAHFTGGAGNSGINAYLLEPRGADFEMVKNEEFMRGAVITGVDFSPDGSGLYLADWTGGWALNAAGRVHRVFDPNHHQDPEVKEASLLLQSDFGKRSVDELIDILESPNMRVRLKAQFELARRGEDSLDQLIVRLGNTSVINQSVDILVTRLARVHSIWALSQISEKSPQPSIQKTLVQLTQDADHEIRAQAAKALEYYPDSLEALVELLESYQGDKDDARPAFFAAQSLGHLKARGTQSAMLDLVNRLKPDQVYLRHAVVAALERIGDIEMLTGLVSDPSDPIRMLAVSVLRRLESPELSRFLNDINPAVVLETARAINDVPVKAALPALADLVDRPDIAWNEALGRRIMNANYRLGSPEHAARIAAVAADTTQSEELRREALTMLERWRQPSSRDRVTGAWVPFEPAVRNPRDAAAALEARLAEALDGSSELQSAALTAAEKLGLKMNPEQFLEWVKDTSRDESSRVAALQYLERNPSQASEKALRFSLEDINQAPQLTGAALSILFKYNGTIADEQMRRALKEGSTQTRQEALTVLKENPTDLTAQWAPTLAEMLVGGEVPEALVLDVFEALSVTTSRPALELLAQFQKDKIATHPMGEYGMVLAGGDFERGRDLFFTRTDAQCVRCHKAGGDDGALGGNVAPNLAGIGKRKGREYILESILYPSRQFAEGYEQATLTMKNGDLIVARILKETDEKLQIEVLSRIAGETEFADGFDNVDFEGAFDDEVETEPENTNDSEAAIQWIELNDIESRERGLSAMPEGLQQYFTLKEIRDLVEYLAGQ